MICYAKLNLSLNLASLQQEVAGLLSSQEWMPHFNSAHYQGDWNILPLRSPGGHVNKPFADLMIETHYEDTFLMSMLPETARTLNRLVCEKLSVRLLNLKAGSVIKEHKDAELAFEKGEARLHIPLFTNNHVEFYVENDRVIMHEGECWYINANLPHRVSNLGITDRIHLVIDCKVNEWLQLAFDKAEKKTRPEVIDKTLQLQIINSLRSHNIPGATAMADQLEQELSSIKLSHKPN